MSLNFRGHRPEMPKAAQSAVNAPSEPRFFFCVHPSRFEVIDGRLLPNLTKFRIAAGTNGVKQNGDYFVAKANFEQRGWTVLGWDCLPEFEAFGEKYTEYLQYFEGIAGPIYTEIWNRPIQTAGGSPTWRFDKEGYRAFLKAIVDAGVTPEPDPTLLEAIETKTQARIDRIAPRSDNNPQLKRALQRNEDLLGVIRKLRQGDSTSTRRGRKPKAKG
jgi:hypothetical protein